MKAKFFFLCWLIAVGISFHILFNYSGEAGRVGSVPAAWPKQSQLHFQNEYELVMFVHPGCTCSSASLSELSRLLSKEEKLKAQVVFMKTKKLDSLFVENDLVKKAQLLPRTKLYFDQDGVEAKKFGALTSGHTFLFHHEKGLLFNGGLTAARGHEGKSQGQESIEQILQNKPYRKVASVFGCDIFGNIFRTESK
jgi:hypothetical protein